MPRKKGVKNKEDAVEISVQTNESEESPIVEQKSVENRQLKNFLFIIGGALIAIFLFVFVIHSIRNFELEGVEWKVVKEKNLVFYNTAVPLYSKVGGMTGSYLVDYNFYLRNDPRKLSEEIPFEGKFFLLQNVVFDTTDSFECDGDGIIAVANFVSLLERMGASVIKDENATCDTAKGKYTYIQLRDTGETAVRQFGLTCYNINIKNCEILKGTERFMLEAFKEINKAEEKSEQTPEKTD